MTSFAVIATTIASNSYKQTNGSSSSYDSSNHNSSSNRNNTVSETTPIPVAAVQITLLTLVVDSPRFSITQQHKPQPQGPTNLTWTHPMDSEGFQYRGGALWKVKTLYRTLETGIGQNPGPCFVVVCITLAKRFRLIFPYCNWFERVELFWEEGQGTQQLGHSK